MAEFKIHFEIAEAQSLIPWVRMVFDRLHAVLDAIETGGSEPQRGGFEDSSTANHPGVLKSPGGANPGPAPAPGDHLYDEAFIASLTREEKLELIRGLGQAILDRGIVIQDIRRGLIDFPAWRDGREILLCYQLDDGDTIRWWHNLADGFAGRQSLDF